MVANQDRHGEGHKSTEASKAPPRSLSPAAERMRRKGGEAAAVKWSMRPARDPGRVGRGDDPGEGEARQ